MSNTQQMGRLFGLVVLGLAVFPATNGRAAVDQDLPHALRASAPIGHYPSELDCKCSGAKELPAARVRLALSAELRNQLKDLRRKLGGAAAAPGQVQLNFGTERRSRAVRSGRPAKFKTKSLPEAGLTPLPSASITRAEQRKLNDAQALRLFEIQQNLDVNRDLRDLLQSQQAQ